MPPLLSAVLIVRDEAAVLADCLRSIKDVVDEIVVVDTGSVDDTAHIAEQYGARLFRHPWRHDFAEARNFALDQASGKWILYIDADERLVAADRETVEELLTGAEEVAFCILLRPYLDSTAYREYRMWRNDPRIRFEGVIHETMVPAIHLVAELDGRPIGFADLLLQHVGYEGDQTRKHLRNLPLLRRQMQNEPDNLFVRHHLARVLEALGQRAEAREVLQDAVNLSRQMTTVDPWGVLAYSDLIRHLMEDGDDYHLLLHEARQTYPDDCSLLWIEGRDLMQRGAYAEALDRFDRLAAVDKEKLPDAGSAYDERLVKEIPHESRALCLFRLGRFAQAAEAYEAAARSAPEDPSYPIKRDLALAKASTTGLLAGAPRLKPD